MHIPRLDAVPKEHVLTAIGRNLVYFQRLETILKCLCSRPPVSGTLPQITKQLVRHRQETDRGTLGSIIPKWLQTARGEEPPAPTPRTDLDVVMSMWINLGIPQHILDEHAKKLEELLTERNWFVHHALVEIDFDSDEACERLLARLKEQEKQVINLIDFLRPILDRSIETDQWLSSPEVQEALMREMLKPITQEETGEDCLGS